MKFFLSLILSVTLIVSVACNQSTPTSKTTTNCIKKHYGLLGHPLGTIITITGKNVQGYSKADEGKILLYIEKVNNTKLNKPVTMAFRLFPWVSPGKKMRSSDSFTLIGYETGAMAGIPEAAFKHIPRVATTMYGFTSWFQICKRIK